MEIDRLRKELTDILENIMVHSRKYSDGRTIPSLEVGAVLTKVNKVQEKMSVLRHLLEQQELAAKLSRQANRVEEVIKPKELNESTPNVSDEVIDIKEEIAEPIIEEVKEETIVVEEILEQSPITKLVDSLTLNDRYLFANELFNKDMSAFNALVKAIDECSNFDEAQKLYLPLNWEIDNEHVSSFTNLVERRFS